MRIEGLRAAVNSHTGKIAGSQTPARPEANTYASDADKPYKNTQQGCSQMPEQEKNELPVSDQEVFQAIEKANKAISISNRRFEYSIHEKTKEIMVKVIDSDTNEVIREIPPEKILDMVSKMWEIAGLIVDEKR